MPFPAVPILEAWGTAFGAGLEVVPLPDVLEDGEAEDGPIGLNSLSPSPRSLAVSPLPGSVALFDSVAARLAMGARWRFRAMVVLSILEM